MKAWISPTAKKILLNPYSREQLEKFIGSRKKEGKIILNKTEYKITRSTERLKEQYNKSLNLTEGKAPSAS